MGAVTPETCRVVLQWINICILLHLLDFYSHWIKMDGTTSFKGIDVLQNIVWNSNINSRLLATRITVLTKASGPYWYFGLYIFVMTLWGWNVSIETCSSWCMSQIASHGAHLMIYWLRGSLFWVRRVHIVVGTRSAVFHNRRAAARYRALASIIPGRERFSWNLSF